MHPVCLQLPSYPLESLEIGFRDLLGKPLQGISLVVQWLGHHTSTAGVTGSNPGQGTKIPHAMKHNQKKKKNAIIKPYDGPYDGHLNI